MSDSKISSLPDLQLIEREAAEWVMRFDDGDASPEDLAAFEAWRHRSPQHQAAAERASDFWGGMAVIDDFVDHAEAEALKEPIRLDAAARRIRPWRRVMAGGIAASIAALCVFGVIQFISTSNSSFGATYVTAVGEQKTVDLPDGSKIVLNTDGAIDVDFTRKERVIRLVRGEAFFDVEHDPSKAFSVLTKSGVVTAVGTAFSVKVSDGHIDVLVTEGRVALAAESITLGETLTRDDDSVNIMEVSAGQSAVYNQKVEKLEVVPPDAIERKLDWQDGLLSFNGEPLHQVVADISRYTDVRIEIADEELAQRRVAALYEVGKIEPMLEALRLTANVEVEHINDRHIRLYQGN